MVNRTLRPGDLVRVHGHPEVLVLVAVAGGVAKFASVDGFSREEPLAVVRGLTAKERRDLGEGGQNGKPR